MQATFDLFSQACSTPTRNVESQAAGVQSLAGSPILERMEKAIQTLQGQIRLGRSLAAALSGGKESSVCTILMVEAIRRERMAGTRMSQHHVNTSSTGVENPLVESHALELHEEIRRFANRQGLDIQTHVVEPSLASCFVVSTVGRGTLPRFPENAQKRTCSDDWKVKPQRRLIKELSARNLAQGSGELVSVIGTRMSESAVRGQRMMRSGEGAQRVQRDAGGCLYIPVIADWDLQDVWEVLAIFMEDETPFPCVFNAASLHRLFDIYRDASDGNCAIVVGDAAERKPCGSRTGCFSCTVAGPRDKSLESLLDTGRYEYMRGLNQLRQLLMATQFDFNRRDLLGRTVSEAGYIQVRPDVYSLEFRRQLLAHMITLDVLEEERAERVSSQLATGAIQKTPHNLLMAEPQFQLVSPSKLLAVDFFWGMHHQAQEAHSAVSVWYEIRHLGRRVPVPSLEVTPKAAVPEKRWYPVGDFDREAPAEGLGDAVMTAWNAYRHEERPIKGRSVKGESTVWFEEGDGLEVNAEAALDFVEIFYPENVVEIRRHEALEGTRFLLNEELVKLPEGMAERYQRMARRGQYFARLAERYGMSASDLEHELLSRSIPDEEHSLLVAKASAEQKGMQVELI